MSGLVHCRSGKSRTGIGNCWPARGSSSRSRHFPPLIPGARVAMALLAGLRVVQVGDGLAAAVCGRLFADIGADVDCVDPDKSSPLATYLNHGKNIVGDQAAALATADLIVCEGQPRDLGARGSDPTSLR